MEEGRQPLGRQRESGGAWYSESEVRKAFLGGAVSCQEIMADEDKKLAIGFSKTNAHDLGEGSR